MAAAKKTKGLKMEIGLMLVSEAQPYERNARTHPQSQVDEIKDSIRAFGYTYPMLVDVDDGSVIAAGHGRHLAVEQMYAAEETIKLPDGREIPNGYIPFIDCSSWTETQRRSYTLADNKIAENSGWDDALLKIEIGELLEIADDEAPVLGFSDDELRNFTGEIAPVVSKGSLSDRFGVPPFSVLNARDGWWADRKKAWQALGIKSEAGRDVVANAKISTFKGKERGGVANQSTSIFDPVLSELSYRWFCPDGGRVLDPFSGGSVRGIVASRLGLEYHGCDLSEKQVASNKEQAHLGGDIPPTWSCGDSQEIASIVAPGPYDFVFSCPPYADLEVYSDHPADISAMKYEDFLTAYRRIISEATKMLADDSFACFVVGDVRDSRGSYRNFVGDTVSAFIDAGLDLYNDAVLVTPVGNTSLTTSRNFPIGRKFGKTHQNVLVFLKGDSAKAVAKLGEPEFSEVDLSED